VSRNFSLLVSAFCSQLILASALAAQPYPQLRLTAEILEQSYCSVKREPTAISLQLKLRLRYTNLSSQRLIVYKGHDLFFQTKIRSEPRAELPPYEVHLLNMHYFDEEFERIEARSPSKVFVTLAPNGSFERDLIIGIGVTDESKERTSTSVKPGGHSLHLIVSTWYQSPKLAEKLREQWQRKGFLWSQPLVSVPLKLDVERPAAASPCR
jgi:hypothetical protein